MNSILTLSIWPKILATVMVFTISSACGQSASEGMNDDCMYITDNYGAEGTTAVNAETVVSGLEVPWGIAFLPNGDLLVTERPGRIRLVRDYSGKAELVEQPVATLTTANTSEGGLLGIAVHP